MSLHDTAYHEREKNRLTRRLKRLLVAQMQRKKAQPVKPSCEEEKRNRSKMCVALETSWSPVRQEDKGMDKMPRWT
uniref:Uncharacterized protein n=1 Tax=Trichuris muris TaxID=70415 RepID=A0A5S6Q8S8_TRIMR